MYITRLHRDLDQYNRLPGNMRGRNDEYYHEETRLPERSHTDGCRENRGLGLTSSRFEPRREILDLSRFIYNWKIIWMNLVSSHIMG